MRGLQTLIGIGKNMQWEEEFSPTLMYFYLNLIPPSAQFGAQLDSLMPTLQVVDHSTERIHLTPDFKRA